MKLSVGFIAAPRDVNYISSTLDSYFEQLPLSSFPTRPTVFEEPGFGSYLNSKKVNRRINGQRKGCVRNWFDALEYLSQLDSDWIVLCEDDISFRPDFCNTVLDYLRLQDQVYVQVISPYCSMPNLPKPAKGYKQMTGWQEPAMRIGLCGALCTIFNKASARYLLDRSDSFFYEATSKNTGILQNLDYAIGQIMPKIIVHYPTLVLHEGVISTFPCNNKPENTDHYCRRPAL